MIDNIASLVLPLFRDTQVPAVLAVVDGIVKILRKLSTLKNLVVVVVNGAVTSSKTEASQRFMGSFLTLKFI